MTEIMRFEGQRRWTRRTRKIVPESTKIILGVEKIAAIKARGSEMLTPHAALTEVGLGVRDDDKSQQILNTLLINVASPDLFDHTDERTVFPAEKIEEFLDAARDVGPNLALLADLPLEEVEAIFKTAPRFFTLEAMKQRISIAARAERKRKKTTEVRENRRSADWGK